MDKLEKHIRDNKESYDPEVPEGLWDKIGDDLENEKPNRNWRKVFAYAAVAIVLIGAGYLLADQPEPKDKVQLAEDKPIEEEAEEVDLGEISPEYAEIERHYTIMVNDRMEELHKLDPNNEFTDELNELEEEYEYLKKELGAGGDDEQVIQAMIENYRLKLKVLEDILSHLKEQNNEVQGVEV